MTGPMHLHLSKPSKAGITMTQGTELLTPDGSKVTGIRAISIGIPANDIVEVTVTLQAVLIHHPDPPA